MRILDRYVVHEFMGPFAISVLAFIVIMLSGSTFLACRLIVQKKVPVLIVARMLLYSLPGDCGSGFACCGSVWHLDRPWQAGSRF